MAISEIQIQLSIQIHLRVFESELESELELAFSSTDNFSAKFELTTTTLTSRPV